MPAASACQRASPTGCSALSVHHLLAAGVDGAAEALTRAGPGTAHVHALIGVSCKLVSSMFWWDQMQFENACQVCFCCTLHALRCWPNTCDQCSLLSAVNDTSYALQKAALGICQALRLEAWLQATLEQGDRAQAARDLLRHAWPEAAARGRAAQGSRDMMETAGACCQQ